jgi:multidrug efflux system membrane fusion protein
LPARARRRARARARRAHADRGAGHGRRQHEYAAEIRARTESRLGFRVGGKLLSRQAEVGQRVKAGQVLAQLDPEDLRLSQEAARRRCRRRRSTTTWPRPTSGASRSCATRASSAAPNSSAARRAEGRAAQLEQARAQAAVQGNQAAYATLVADAAGRGHRRSTPSPAVLAAGTPVLRLAHDGPRDAVFAVPEDAVAAAACAARAARRAAVTPGAAGRALPATVREVAAAADPVTRTFLVKADLSAPPLQLGQTATVSIELPRPRAIRCCR